MMANDWGEPTEFELARLLELCLGQRTETGKAMGLGWSSAVWMAMKMA